MSTAFSYWNQLLVVATDIVLTDALLRDKVALKAAIDEGLRTAILMR